MKGARGWGKRGEERVVNKRQSVKGVRLLKEKQMCVKERTSTSIRGGAEKEGIFLKWFLLKPVLQTVFVRHTETL
jgi:hypothetical protein